MSAPPAPEVGLYQIGSIWKDPALISLSSEVPPLPQSATIITDGEPACLVSGSVGLPVRPPCAVVPYRLRNFGVSLLFMCGCATENFQDSFSKNDPKPVDGQKKSSWLIDANGNNDDDAAWTKIGKEMRGDQPAKKEEDALKDSVRFPACAGNRKQPGRGLAFCDSPKARGCVPSAGGGRLCVAILCRI